MIATRLPRRSTSWFQRAVCMVSPANVSWPSIAGGLGCEKTPVAPITKRAVIVSPPAVAIRHTFASSSKSAPTTLVFKRMRSRTPYLSTQCSAYALSSSPGAYTRDQSLRFSNENW